MERLAAERRMTARTAQDWIRALEDCGVLRVRFDDEALIRVIESGMVDASPVDGDDDALDVRLSDAAILKLHPSMKLPARDPKGRATAGGEAVPLPAPYSQTRSPEGRAGSAVEVASPGSGGAFSLSPFLHATPIS